MSAKTVSTTAPEARVKRVLRHRPSRQYFRNGSWTGNPDEAENFSDILQAAEVCVRHDLADVELALRLEDGAEDIFCTALR